MGAPIFVVPKDTERWSGYSNASSSFLGDASAARDDFSTSVEVFGEDPVSVSRTTIPCQYESNVCKQTEPIHVRSAQRSGWRTGLHFPQNSGSAGNQVDGIGHNPVAAMAETVLRSWCCCRGNRCFHRLGGNPSMEIREPHREK